MLREFLDFILSAILQTKIKYIKHKGTSLLKEVLMNVFMTKEGKIFKVSLANFELATLKKSPYYKRVKEKDKLVEKGYAICPGCGNPLHFVNLFNAKKKKKAYARHQRSSIKRLAEFNSTNYKSCPYTNKHNSSYSDNTTSKIEIPSFSNVLTTTFGFSRSNSDLLVSIFIKLNDWNPEEANQLFFALLASCSYNNVSANTLNHNGLVTYIKETLSGALWTAVGDIKQSEAAQEELASLGFNKADIKDLFDELKSQHSGVNSKTSSYYGRPDFTHFCATSATVLCKKPEKIAGSLAAGLFHGIFSVDDSVGYIGDLCGTDGAEPSMNNADYKADLDAVNITSRMMHNSNSTVISVFCDYYHSIDTGKTNRAREFKSNVSLKTLKEQRSAYYSTLSNSSLNDTKVKEKISLFDRFILNIEKENDDWGEDE